MIHEVSRRKRQLQPEKIWSAKQAKAPQLGTPAAGFAPFVHWRGSMQLEQGVSAGAVADSGAPDVRV